MSAKNLSPHVAALFVMLGGLGVFAPHDTSRPKPSAFGATAQTYYIAPRAPGLPAVIRSSDVVLPRYATRWYPTATSPSGLPCGLSVRATPVPGETVALEVVDPCQPDVPVMIAHAGLTMTERTDAEGRLSLDVPARETPAFFHISLPDGSHDIALVGLPEPDEYDRIAVR